MKAEDRNLLLKDLCARLPYKVMIQSVGENKCLGLMDLVDIDSLPKPYLRPMSSMTEEEKEEMYHDCYIVSIDFDRRTTDMVAVPNSTKIVDWLNAHHFDYHNLIERGMAIKVTEENNPYKD